MLSSQVLACLPPNLCLRFPLAQDLGYRFRVFATDEKFLTVLQVQPYA
jgi:hypothetical protein